MANENNVYFEPDFSIENAANLVNNYRFDKKKAAKTEDKLRVSADKLISSVSEIHDNIENLKLTKNKLYSTLLSGYVGYHYLKRINDECKNLKHSTELYNNIGQIKPNSLYATLSEAAADMPSETALNEIRSVGNTCYSYFKTIAKDMGQDDLEFKFKVSQYSGSSSVIENPDTWTDKTWSDISTNTPFAIKNHDYIISELGIDVPGAYTVNSDEYPAMYGNFEFDKNASEDYPSSVTLDLKSTANFRLENGTFNLPYNIGTADELKDIMATKFYPSTPGTTIISYTDKNVDLNLERYYLITNDIEIHDYDDPGLYLYFPVSSFIGAKNGDPSTKVTITIYLSTDKRKNNRKINDFMSLFSEYKLLKPENFFYNIDIIIKRGTHRVDKKSFAINETYAEKEFSYQNCVAGNITGQIALNKTGDRSIFSEFSSSFPIYTYENIDNPDSGYSNFGIEIVGDDRLILGIAISKGNTFGVIYIPLTLSGYSKNSDMLANSTNAKIKLLYALGAIGTLKDYNADESLENYKKDGFAPLSAKFFEMNYYVNLLSLISNEYLQNAVKYEVSTSESKISYISVLATSVITIEAYRMMYDSLYNNAYTEAITNAFVNISAKSDSISSAYEETTETTGGNNNNNNTNNDSSTSTDKNTGKFIGLSIPNTGNDSGSSGDSNNTTGGAPLRRQKTAAQLGTITNTISKVSVSTNEIISIITETLPIINDIIYQASESIKAIDDVLESKAGLFNRSKSNKATTDYAALAKETLSSFETALRQGGSTSYIEQPNYKLRSFSEWSSEMSKYCSGNVLSMVPLYIVQELGINMSEILTDPMNTDIEKTTISLFNYIFNQMYFKGFWNENVISDYYKNMFFYKKNFYENYDITIGAELNAQYLPATLLNEFPAIEYFNTYSIAGLTKYADDLFNSDIYTDMRNTTNQKLLSEIFKNKTPLKNISTMSELLNSSKNNLRTLILRSLLGDLLKDIYNSAISINDDNIKYITMSDESELSRLMSEISPIGEAITISNGEKVSNTVDIIKKRIEEYIQCWLFFYGSNLYMLSYLDTYDANSYGSMLYAYMLNK